MTLNFKVGALLRLFSQPQTGVLRLKVYKALEKPERQKQKHSELTAWMKSDIRKVMDYYL